MSIFRASDTIRSQWFQYSDSRCCTGAEKSEFKCHTKMGDHERIGHDCVKVYQSFAETDSDVKSRAVVRNKNCL